MPRIPASVLCRSAAALLRDRADRLTLQSGSGAAHKAPGRQAQAKRWRDQAGRLAALADSAKGEVDAAAAGLLLAWAAGWQDAIGQLEEIDPRIEAVPGEDVAAGVGLIIGA